MGLLNFLSNLENNEEENNEDFMFDTEAEIYGLTESDIEACKKSGLTPGEWRRAWRKADNEDYKNEE